MQIVRCAGQHNVVLFRALQQAIQQPFVGINFLLDYFVVDRGLVLRTGSSPLLFERRSQRFLAVECFMVTRLEALASVEAAVDRVS